MSIYLLMAIGSAVGVGLALFADERRGWRHRLGAYMLVAIIATSFTLIARRGRQIDQLRLRVIALEKAEKERPR